jgi:predicted MFS family arabinose efflux permease
MAGEVETAARYRDVFAVGEFRALFGGHLQSVIGDQLARVALAILVFNRTHSPGLTALTYALTFIPDLIGGPLLSGLADRLPRRRLMIGCDLIRAVLVAAMAVRGMPIWALCVLLVLTQLAGAPFSAARAAVLPTVLPGDRYVVGNGLMNMTFQTGLLCGAAGGAPLVTLLGTSWALLLDAASFLLSVVLIAWGVRPHFPPRDATGARTRTTWGSLRNGLRIVAHDRRLRSLLAIACLVGFYVVPLGLAVPYAAQLGVGTPAVGLLLAADPAGSALGAILITRLVSPDWRLRLLGPMAIATSAVLLPTAFLPPLWLTVLLWFLCGLLSSHDTVTSATFMRAVPDESRGQTFGLASASLRVAQGLGIACAGLVAEFTPPATTIAVFAGAGVAVGCVVASAWNRARPAGANA